MHEATVPSPERHAEPLHRHARDPDALETLAIAGTIATAEAHALPPALWLRGLDPDECARMLDTLFPGARATAAGPAPAAEPPSDDEQTEFDDLLQLLLEAAEPRTPESRWLACAVATAALFDNHLWQDLRLPDRRALSALLQQRFPALAARNTGNMRWKAFFYKQLCERAGMVCRAPSCGACDDYEECFGPE